MRRAEALQRLHEVLPVVKERFGVQSLAVFGSVARDEATDQSDIDVLVDFEGRATFDNFMGLKERIEDALGLKVDLVTRRALKPLIKPRIEAEAIHVA